MIWFPTTTTLSLPPWVRWPSQTTVRHVFYGVVLGISLSLSTRSLVLYIRSRRRRRLAENNFSERPIELRSDEILHGVTGLIGNTPLVRINSLSDILGVEILGKAEYLNPGGSVKDRVALRMIDDAERMGYLRPHTGSRIFEGTVGSTGISIATIAKARGYDTTIIMPDDVAEEKVKALQALGATVERVRPASIVDKKQYVNLARQRAKQFGAGNEKPSEKTTNHTHTLDTGTPSVVVTSKSHHVKFDTQDTEAETDFLNQPRGYFADQFENNSNFEAHFDGTGPEIWRQTNGKIDAFVSGAGTGGTIAGIGRYLKSVKEDALVALSDPEGSGLYNKVKHGVMFDRKEAEGTKRRHQVDTVVEGMSVRLSSTRYDLLTVANVNSGINRLTHNIDLALPIIDDAFRIKDAEAVSMSRYLVQHDGLFLGSSSACNLVACVKLIRRMGWGEGQTVVTVLCDSGTRHYSKFWNDEYLRKAGIPVDPQIVEDLLQPLPALEKH